MNKFLHYDGETSIPRRFMFTPRILLPRITVIIGAIILGNSSILMAQVATPTFSPDGGAYAGTANVVIACATSGAVIHYTTNGADPTQNDPVVNSGSAVLIGRNLTLKANAWVSGSASATKTASYQATGQLVAGLNHSLAIRPDGSLWSWGSNNFGQLGNGSTVDQWFPGQVSGLSNVRAAAGGTSHSVAVKADGTVWAWGYNASGQLGDGTTTQRISPVQVSGLTGGGGGGGWGCSQRGVKERWDGVGVGL